MLVARRRLSPLGIDVIAVEGAPDNVDQSNTTAGGSLPFPDGDFHLVVSRHESYRPREIRRVLAPDGLFLTQQVGSGATDDFFRLFDAPVPPVPAAWTLDVAVRQLEETGFDITDQAEGLETMAFADVGALAWYLRTMPFVWPDFSVAAAREKLWQLHLRHHQEARPLEIRQPLFRLTAHTKQR